MTIKKYNFLAFNLVTLISFSSISLLLVDADYLVYVDNLNKASGTSFLNFINEIDHEYGYNALLYIFFKLGIDSYTSFVIFSNLILYSLVGKIVYNLTRDYSFERQVLIIIVVFCNPLFFILSANIVRQLLSYSILYYLVSGNHHLKTKSIFKYFLLVIPVSIHLSSLILIFGYLMGSVKKLDHKIIFLLACFFPILFSKLIYNYFGLNIFHSEIYDPPKIVLIILCLVMLIYLKVNKISNQLFFSLYLPIALLIGLYDLTQFSSRMILILHFVYVFFVAFIFKKLNLKFSLLITVLSFIFFNMYVVNYVN